MQPYREKVSVNLTIKELVSLNRTIESGELKCMDCNSTHISFKSAGKNSYNFDVSTTEIRNQILESISEKINAYNEEIENYTFEINVRQEEMKRVLEQDEVSLELLVAFKNEIFTANDAEKRINIINDEIGKLEDDLLRNDNESKEIIQKQQTLINEITDLMNSIYSIIDSAGNLEFESIYTKSNQIFSGIVDSFRAEDLSSEKELKVLDLFSKLNIQVIFTTTLKIEEIGKYHNMEFITHIDYSKHTASKILSRKYLDEFEKLTEDFSIKL